MREINPYNTPAQLNDAGTQNRYKKTKAFVEKHLLSHHRKTLDIGAKNPFGQKLGEELNLDIVNTVGDLDYDGWHPLSDMGYFDVVFCFEIIEHLLNPLHFLDFLKYYTHTNSYIFISYPARPKLLWVDHHFHEYDRKRFKYLVDRAELVIVDEAHYNIADLKHPWRYFKGLRTPLRLYYERTNLYLLEKKNGHN